MPDATPAIQDVAQKSALRIADLRDMVARISEFGDEEVALFADMVKTIMDDERDKLGAILNAAKLELLRRMQERGARAIPSPLFEKIEREDEFAPYVADFDKLSEAKKLLKEDEAAKLFTHYAGGMVWTPPRDEAGNANAINAIIKKYGIDKETGEPTSEVGKLIREGFYHVKTGEKVVIKSLPKPAEKLA